MMNEMMSSLYDLALFATFGPLSMLRLTVLFRFDYLGITNEKGKSFGKHCGGPYRKDVTVDVNGNYTWLQFHSDADLQKRGFLLYFSTFPLPSKYKKNWFQWFRDFRIARSDFARPSG